jgi:hypothetical protein
VNKEKPSLMAAMAARAREADNIIADIYTILQVLDAQPWRDIKKTNSGTFTQMKTQQEALLLAWLRQGQCIQTWGTVEEKDRLARHLERLLWSYTAHWVTPTFNAQLDLERQRYHQWSLVQESVLQTLAFPALQSLLKPLLTQRQQVLDWKSYHYFQDACRACQQALLEQRTQKLQTQLTTAAEDSLNQAMYGAGYRKEALPVVRASFELVRDRVLASNSSIASLENLPASLQKLLRVTHPISVTTSLRLFTPLVKFHDAASKAQTPAACLENSAALLHLKQEIQQKPALSLRELEAQEERVQVLCMPIGCLPIGREERREQDSFYCP